MATHIPFTFSIPCYKLLEAYFTVSGSKMRITNKFLTNQRRPYKLELQQFQQKLDEIDMSKEKWRCIIIEGGAL